MTYTDAQLAKLEGVMLETYQRELGLILNDPERLKEIYGSVFLESDLSLKLNSICATACQLLGTPSAEVNLVTDREQITIASFGAGGLRRVQLDRSYCQHVVGGDRTLSIQDTLLHKLVCRSSVTTEMGIRAYLGVPLISRKGHVFGSLCTWAYEERLWTETEVSMMTSLAFVVMRFQGGDSDRQG